MRVVYFVLFFFFGSLLCLAWLGLASCFYFPTVSGTHRAAQIKITKTKWNQRFSKHTILQHFFFTMHACAFVSLSLVLQLNFGYYFCFSRLDF